jgi:site-specific recombinase XerD
LGWDGATVKDIVKIPRAIETKDDSDKMTIQEVQAMFKASKNNPLSNSEQKCLYYGALRKSELIALNIDDVKSEQKIVVIRNGKGKNGQPETITPKQEFFDAVADYLRYRPTPKAGHEKALFIRPTTQERITKDSLRNDIKNTQFESGIRPDKQISAHWYRASMLTHMHENGANLMHIMSLSRHRSIDAVKRYIRPSIEQKRANIDRFCPSITEERIETPQPKQEQPQVMFAKPIEKQPEQLTLKQQYYQLLKQGLITPQEFQDLLSNSTNNMYG